VWGFAYARPTRSTQEVKSEKKEGAKRQKPPPFFFFITTKWRARGKDLVVRRFRIDG